MRSKAVCLALITNATFAIAADQYMPERNEIFYKDKDGTERILLPPRPVKSNGKPVAEPSPLRPIPAGGSSEVVRGLFMIQTQTGLIECSNAWVVESACRASSIGVLKAGRTWVVRRGGAWQHCAGPSTTARCWSPPAQNDHRTKLSFDNFEVVL